MRTGKNPWYHPNLLPPHGGQPLKVLLPSCGHLYLGAVTGTPVAAYLQKSFRCATLEMYSAQDAFCLAPPDISLSSMV